MDFHPHQSKGFSLIELLLVLAIVAALAVAAFVVYPRVQAGRNAAFEAQILTSVQATARALFTRGDYRSIYGTQETRALLFPEHMFVGGVLQNQWGGGAAIGPSTHEGNDAGAVSRALYFRIVYSQVPTDVCIRLAGAVSNHFGAIRINKNPNNHNGGVLVQNMYGSPQMSLDEGLVAEQCKGNGGRATMIFVSN